MLLPTMGTCYAAPLQENKRKEEKILEDMKRLVDSTLGPTEPGPAADE
jgi:hypothetical protein